MVALAELVLVELLLYTSVFHFRRACSLQQCARLGGVRFIDTDIGEIRRLSILVLIRIYFRWNGLK